MPDVLLRHPGVHAHTHTYIATGQNDSKFGFNLANGDAERAATGASVTVGQPRRLSQPHRIERVRRRELRQGGRGDGRLRGRLRPRARPRGGLGVAYVADESAPSTSEWAAAVLDACASAGVTADISVEPGRALVAGAAVTLYTVGTIKRIPDVRTYVAVDGGMSDNPRPVLYGSGYEAMLPRPLADRPRRTRIVGKHCESGDILIFDAHVPADIAVGDVLAVPVTGAYGHSMGSNYNKVPRPAIVFAEHGDARLVVRRETYDDLLLTDVG